MQKTSFFSKFLTKKYIISLVIILVVVFIAVNTFGGGNSGEILSIQKGDVVQEVSATGKVKPNESVSMGFDQTGRVARVYVDVGSSVKTGDILASLEAGEASANVAKAKASLDEELVKLREVKNTAPSTYTDAYKNLEATLRDSFAVADNAVRNRADQFFKNTSPTPNFEVSITTGNFVHYFNIPYDLELDINNKRSEVETILGNWQKNISTINSENAVSLAEKSINDLNTVLVFLNKVAAAINTFTPADFDYESTVNTYKSTISSARSEVSKAITDIVVAKDKINNSPILGSGGEFESVLAQEAKVAQSRANLASLEATLRKFLIVAPFDGVVTVQDAKVGGTVTAGTPVISMIGQKEDVYIEADISEINIGKISEGNLVEVTFDAFPGEAKQGVVYYIEPGDFLIDGVVNYKIRVRLQGDPDLKVKAGLTANLKIETASSSDVLIVPQYAVIKEKDGNYVNKIVGDKVEKVKVDLGLEGSNGFTRILGGLEEGDQIKI